ncbi:FkbM family methyltransferase [Flavobacterium piscisymbiosum]|uniref:FkbM family methyltransferase n=1 Tax=Flavobacterium piscisymbiosum TaxID=2893753 RepID=A0ABS8M8D3_9FLAO|nr:FkbM family methyltransferase [Flavobacterium sp. F-30]MCC9061724.1 FkbM family methyltransferase [Flavobacterium sp. F-30]
MKLKRLRKIYRALFPIKLSGYQIFINNLNTNKHIIDFKKVENLYTLVLQNGKKLYCRDQNHSDYYVFNQMFSLEEYSTVSSVLNINEEFDSKQSVLIDAGANVGYAAIYLSQKKAFDKIFCIEPSKSNFEILKKNVSSLNIAANVTLLENALAATENESFNIDNNFRDGKDWSIATTQSENGEVEGITINEIIKEYNLQEITLLKIDIEGAERFIFKESANLIFLEKTKIIVIEIHDEFNIREDIYKILKNNNFLLIESGEVTIAINKKFI